jgi:Flp pilus assembly protein TadG
MFAHPSRRRTRRGAAAVEFAVVAPLLVLIVFGIVEVGRLVMVAQLATNGSREAARYAVQAAATPDAVTSYTESYMAAAGIPGSAINSITIEQNGAAGWAAVSDLSLVAAGTPIRVTLSINFNRVSWLPTRVFIADNTPVQGITVMRKE